MNEKHEQVESNNRELSDDELELVSGGGLISHLTDGQNPPEGLLPAV